MPETLCRECKSPLLPGKLKCLKCGTWNHGNQIQSVDIDPYTVLLSDSEIDNLKRISTGLVDPLFGDVKEGEGGFAVGTVALLGGDAGAGKTTLGLQISSHMAKVTGREALIIGVEQRPKSLRKVAKRLELENRDRIRVVKAYNGLPFSLPEIVLKYNPCMVILDSITDWIGEDLDAAIPICKGLKDVVDSIDACCIVICQITKKGGFAGLKKVEHAVDWTGMFDNLGDKMNPKPEDVRMLHSYKNREGPAPFAMFFQMDKHGLFEVGDPDLIEESKKKVEIEAEEIGDEENGDEES